VAFKVSPANSEDDEDPKEDEIMSMIVWRVERMFYKNGRLDKKNWWHRKKKDKEKSEMGAIISRSLDN